jgi:hypothetical protein
MKASDFRELVRETFLYLLEEDEEFQLEVSEKLQSLGVLTESKVRKPQYPDLLENLKLLAEGKSSQMSIGGQKIKSPRLKGAKSKKWAMSIYEKFGGTWTDGGEVLSEASHRRASDTLEFISSMGGGDAKTGEGTSIIRAAASSNNAYALKEAISSIPTKMNAAVAFNEDRASTEDVDMSAILMDTAKTTLLKQPVSHNASMMTAPDAASLVVSQKTPDQLFGSDMANGTWAKLAFQEIGE